MDELQPRSHQTDAPWTTATSRHTPNGCEPKAGRSSRTPSTPDLADAISEDLLRLERDLGIVPADNLFEGRRTTRIYNLLVHGPLYERIPVHPNVLPDRRAESSIPGLLISSLSSIAIGSDEDAQPIHADDQLIPLPKPHPPLICNTMWAITDFTEENGATRLCPGHPPGRPLPRPTRALRLHPGRDAQRQRARLGRQPVARGRSQHHRRAPGRDRHELLRRVPPPAGEPTARHPARHRAALPPTPAGAGRLLDLQRAHRPHRQAAPRKMLLGAEEDSSLVWDYAKGSEA